MRERELIAELLAPLAVHRAARGLADDAAVWLPPLGREIVMTHDVIASGVHYLPGDPPSDVAWKLLAVNLSDLAAMGATPFGVLLGVTLGGHEDEAWLRGFAAGLARALGVFGVALLGGDTVRWGGAAVLGCTAVGTVARGRALGRGGARVGDEVWVSGTVGDAGLGLALVQVPPEADARYLVNRYRRPTPRLALGQSLTAATACMDVSDGLLIDAQRLALASAVRVEIDLTQIPLSDAARRYGDDDTARLARVTAGDDYELLFTASADAGIAALATAKVPLTRIGRVVAGAGLRVLGSAGDLTPDRLGWEH